MSDYYVATMGAVSVIVKAPGKQSSAYIDLLSFSSSTDFLLMKNLIAHIAIWGIDKGYSYIRYYSSDKQLSVYLQRQLLSHIAHPRFGFFSKNEQLFSQAKATKWYWELIDSDFEGF